MGAELLKHKNAKKLLLEKKQKEAAAAAAAVANSTTASMIVNTELQDPRSQPPNVHSSSRHHHHQPSSMPPQHNLGARDGVSGLQSNGQASSVTNLSVVPRRGQRAPPHRPAALPMPPGHGLGLEMGRSHMGSDGSSPVGMMGGVRGRSIISSLPLPSISEDEDSQGKAGKRKRKPKVIGKPMPTKMCEDGSEWGERCIEIYEIVDKVGEGKCCCTINFLHKVAGRAKITRKIK